MCVRMKDSILILNSISKYDDSSGTSRSLVLTVATCDFDASILCYIICIYRSKTVLSIPLLGVDVNIATGPTVQVTDVSLFHVFQRKSVRADLVSLANKQQRVDVQLDVATATGLYVERAMLSNAAFEIPLSHVQSISRGWQHVEVSIVHIGW